MREVALESSGSEEGYGGGAVAIGVMGGRRQGLEAGGFLWLTRERVERKRG